MPISALWLTAEIRSRVRASTRRVRGDRGEGVISAAIAVLIMAFLGALMWASFHSMWQRTEANTNKNVDKMTQE